MDMRGKISFESRALKHQLPELLTSFLASKQTAMGLCHERQHFCFWKETSDGLICWDMGAGHSSSL